MPATSHYTPIAGPDDNTIATSSQESAASTRFTPTTDSDEEEEEEDDGLDDLEREHGFELSEVGEDGRRLQASRASTRAGGKYGGVEEDDDDDDANRPRRHRRHSSALSFELYTPDEERRVRRKLDTHLVLFVALLYLMSFLDRSNIGNAKIAGLTDDLRLSDDQYEWLLTAFYITYILFEWMTLCYKIFPPHIYISCCVCAWGILASLQAITSTWSSLLVLRALLGIGEAAFVGIPFYLSFFYRQDELAFRIGLFVSAAPLATSFASSLAWAIVSFGDRTGIASWRLLFLLEGFPACLVAVWAWWWIPDAPSTARWLTSRERQIATLRMRNEGSSDPVPEKKGSQATVPRHRRKFQWREVLRTLQDPKSYLTAGMFFCCNVAFSSMPVFLPTIVSQMGFTRLASQGLSAPPFLFSFLIVLLTAFLSDRYQSRSVPMMLHAALATAGYTFLAVAGAMQFSHTIPRYLAVFPICAGFFSAVTLVITWTVNNQTSDEGKGTGMAILNVIGQLGPLLGTRLYPDSDGPFYVKGMAVCAGSMAVVVALAFALRVVLKRENSRRMREWRGGDEAEGQALVRPRDQRRREGFMYIT